MVTEVPLHSESVSLVIIVINIIIVIVVTINSFFYCYYYPNCQQQLVYQDGDNLKIDQRRQPVIEKKM